MSDEKKASEMACQISELELENTMLKITESEHNFRVGISFIIGLSFGLLATLIEW